MMLHNKGGEPNGGHGSGHLNVYLEPKCLFRSSCHKRRLYRLAFRRRRARFDHCPLSSGVWVGKDSILKAHLLSQRYSKSVILEQYKIL